MYNISMKMQEQLFNFEFHPPKEINFDYLCKKCEKGVNEHYTCKKCDNKLCSQCIINKLYEVLYQKAEKHSDYEGARNISKHYLKSKAETIFLCPICFGNDQDFENLEKIKDFLAPILKSNPYYCKLFNYQVISIKLFGAFNKEDESNTPKPHILSHVIGSVKKPSSAQQYLPHKSSYTCPKCFRPVKVKLLDEHQNYYCGPNCDNNQKPSDIFEAGIAMIQSKKFSQDIILQIQIRVKEEFIKCLQLDEKDNKIFQEIMQNFLNQKSAIISGEDSEDTKNTLKLSNEDCAIFHLQKSFIQFCMYILFNYFALQKNTGKYSNFLLPLKNIGNIKTIPISPNPFVNFTISKESHQKIKFDPEESSTNLLNILNLKSSNIQENKIDKFKNQRVTSVDYPVVNDNTLIVFEYHDGMKSHDFIHIINIQLSQHCKVVLGTYSSFGCIGKFKNIITLCSIPVPSQKLILPICYSLVFTRDEIKVFHTPLNVPCAFSSLVKSKNGMLSLGGYYENYSTNCELLEEAKMKWVQISPLAEKKSEISGICLNNTNIIYAFGGSLHGNIQRIDLDKLNSKWEIVKFSKFNFPYKHCIQINSNFICILGGFDNSNSIYIYNISYKEITQVFSKKFLNTTSNLSNIEFHHNYYFIPQGKGRILFTQNLFDNSFDTVNYFDI